MARREVVPLGRIDTLIGEDKVRQGIGFGEGTNS